MDSMLSHYKLDWWGLSKQVIIKNHKNNNFKIKKNINRNGTFLESLGIFVSLNIFFHTNNWTNIHSLNHNNISNYNQRVYYFYLVSLCTALIYVMWVGKSVYWGQVKALSWAQRGNCGGFWCTQSDSLSAKDRPEQELLYVKPRDETRPNKQDY